MASRSVSDRTILEKFVEDFVKVLERHAKYMVVSGFVAIAHGRARGTEDIDLIAEKMGRAEFAALFGDLAKSGFECIQSAGAGEAFEYLNEGLSIRFARKGSFVPEMEFKFAKDALDEYQLAHRKKLPLTGLGVFFSSIEANIAFKEELLKSDKDLEDARHLRIIYSGQLDAREISKFKRMIREYRLKGIG